MDPTYSTEPHFRWEAGHPETVVPPSTEFVWNAERDELITCVLRLVCPPPSQNGVMTTREIRAFARNAEITTTLFRSVQEGSTRIVLTPSATVTEAGILEINLNVSAEVGDAADGEEYRRLWDGFITNAAPRFTGELAIAIEASLQGRRLL